LEESKLIDLDLPGDEDEPEEQEEE